MAEAFRMGMQSFLQEAQIMSEFVETPHVVTFYEVLEANDTVYLSMEYIEGLSAGRRMRERKYLPYKPKEMARILIPALDGLERMHEKNIIHSDISPGSFFDRPGSGKGL